MRLRFELDEEPHQYTIKSYGPGWVMVNEMRLTQSVIVTPDQLVLDWPPQAFVDVEAAHFATIAALAPEIVLLGTGEQQRFPHPRLMQALMQQGIGFEVMDTAAACRTYNVIMLEGRKVAAALLLA